MCKPKWSVQPSGVQENIKFVKLRLDTSDETRGSRLKINTRVKKSHETVPLYPFVSNWMVV